MPDLPHRYYYGRLNVLGVYNDKEAFILQGLGSERVVESHNHIWQFVQIQTIRLAEGGFVHGYLVKYKRERAEEVVVPAAGQLQDVAIPNVVMAKARFFLHTYSGLIAYHPVTNQIEPAQFRDRFQALFRENHEALLVGAEIDTIQEEYTIREQVRRMTVVTKMHISLHPSNPNSREVWRRYDERFQRLGVSTYTEDYKLRPDRSDGETLLTDDELLSKLLMAEDGYGVVSVTGRIDGKVKTVRTHDKPLTSEAPNDDATAINVLESLLLVMQQLFRRFER